MIKIKLLSIFICIGISSLYAQTKTLSKAAYTIKYPDDWRVEENSNSSFTLAAPSDSDNDAFVENINFVSYPVTGYLPRDYAQYSKTTLPQKIKNFKVVDEKKIKQGGKIGYYMIFKGKQNNQLLKWKQYYFIKKGIAFVLTFTAEEKMFKTYTDKLNSCLNSFIVK